LLTSSSVFQSTSVAGLTVIKYQPCGKPRTLAKTFGALHYLTSVIKIQKMGTIIINRLDEKINNLVPYTVFLDGKKIGYIENGKTKSFEVSPGDHILHCRIDWARSKKVKFTISNEEIKFQVRGFNHSRTLIKYGMPLSIILFILGFFIPLKYAIIPLVILALPLLYYMTIGYNKYLVLKIIEKNI
jgi:hypothetical protein